MMRALGLWRNKNEQCLFVAVRMQVEVPLHREIDHLLDPIRFGRLSVNVKLPDADGS